METGTTTKITIKAKSPQKPAEVQRDRPARLRGSRVPGFVWLFLGLIIGVGGGVQFMRFRNTTRENEVVVAVNGAPIRRSDFFYRLEQVAGPVVIRQMLAEELAIQFARKSGTEPTPEMIEARISELKKQPEFEKQLANSGLTKNDLRRGLKLSLTQSETFGKGVTVTEKDMREFYQANIDRNNPRALYYIPDTASIAAIVTKTQSEAQKALAELEAGKSFKTVALKNSIDESKNRGGVQPLVVRGRTGLRKVPNMEKTIFTMKIGQTTKPLKFVNYWWIIHCLDKKPEKTLPYEEVKTECRQGAMLVKGLPANSTKVQKDYQEFQKNAKVQAFWKRYENAVKMSNTQ